MRLRDIALALIMLVIGLCAGYAMQPASVEAQNADIWELQSGSFGSQSFFAIKLNRSTGETWVLSGERGATDDRWLQLPEEKVQKK